MNEAKHAEQRELFFNFCRLLLTHVQKTNGEKIREILLRQQIPLRQFMAKTNSQSFIPGLAVWYIRALRDAADLLPENGLLALDGNCLPHECGVPIAYLEKTLAESAAWFLTASEAIDILRDGLISMLAEQQEIPLPHHMTLKNDQGTYFVDTSLRNETTSGWRNTTGKEGNNVN